MSEQQRERELYRPGDPLSPDEAAALTWVATGLTNRAISTVMSGDLGKYVAEATIATWLHRALVKLRAENRTHAVVLALVRGDIKIPGIPYPAAVIDIEKGT